MIRKLLVSVLILTTTACTTFQHQFKNYLNKPEVSYKSVSIKKLAIDAIEFNSTFNIINKNAFSIPINEANYDLFLNNNKVLSSTTDFLGTLPANQDKNITFPLSLTQGTLISLQHILLRDKQINYRIKGNVNALGLSIPFEQSNTLYAPHLSILDMEVIRANFTQLDIILKLKVTNSNNFDLPLENIHYSVSSNHNILFSDDIKNKNILKGNNIIQLPLSIKPNRLFPNLFALLNNPILPLHIEINTLLFNQSYDHTLNLSSFFTVNENVNIFNL